MKRLFAAVCVFAAFGSSASAATVDPLKFVFSWSSLSAAKTTDATLAATGHAEIDAEPGATFSAADLLSLSIDLIGDTIDDISFDLSAPLVVFDGEIAADGLSASFFDFFVGEFDVIGFGCDFLFCAQGNGYNIAAGRTPDNVLATATYDTPEDALKSLMLKAVIDKDPGPKPEVVPLPATAPMLLAGLGLLALWRRTRRSA